MTVELQELRTRLEAAKAGVRERMAVGWLHEIAGLATAVSLIDDMLAQPAPEATHPSLVGRMVAEPDLFRRPAQEAQP